MSDTYYEMLGVAPDASKEEIRDAYREQVAELKQRQEASGKRAPSPGQVQEARERVGQLNKAWAVLADETQRRRYDASLTEAVDDGEEVVAGEGPSSSPAEAIAPAERLTFRERMRRRTEDAQRQGLLTPDPDAAPTGRRLAADGIDVVTYFALVLGTQLLIGTLFDLDADDVGVTYAVTAGALALWMVVYGIVPNLYGQQTLGKRLTGLKLVDAETRAAPAPWAVVKRYGVLLLLIAAPLGGGMGAALALLLGVSWSFAKNRVSLLDRLARTRVVGATTP